MRSVADEVGVVIVCVLGDVNVLPRQVGRKRPVDENRIGAHFSRRQEHVEVTPLTGHRRCAELERRHRHLGEINPLPGWPR